MRNLTTNYCQMSYEFIVRWHRSCLYRYMDTRYLKKLNRLEGLVVLVLALVCWTNSVHAAPELKVTSDKGPWNPGRHYKVICEISWSGNAGDYTILPAEPGKMDWATITAAHAESTVRNGVQAVTQTIDLVPTKTGEFTVPEIRVSYLNPETTSPAEKATPGTTPSESSASPSLRSDPFTIVVRPARTLFWISGGLGASLLLIFVGWAIVRYRGKRSPTNKKEYGTVHSKHEGSSEADVARAQNLVRDARVKQMNGDFYGFYLALAQAATAVPENASLAQTFEKRGQDVGYKGMRPTQDMMDGDLRDIERALARHISLQEGEDTAP